VNWEILGAISMSMFTAYGSIFIAGETKKGDTVLIHGGTSSVGIWGVLLAKDRGCTVIATTRNPGKLEKLKAVGADHAFLEENLAEEVKKVAPDGVDMILELVGPDKLVDVSLPLLARHGTVVCSGVLTKEWKMDGFTPALIPATRKLSMYSTKDEPHENVQRTINEVVGKVESGVFKSEAFLDRVFSLEEAGEAQAYMEENRAIGKVVLKV